MTTTESTALDVVEVTAPTNVVALAQSTVPALPAEVVDQVATAVATLDAKMSYARLLAQSNLIPDQLVVYGRGGAVDEARTVANVFLVMEYGQLLNIHPVIALSEINVVKGKVGVSAKLMRARVYEAGHDIKVLETDTEQCTVHIIRGDGKSSEPWTFTMDEARKMGLVRDGTPWKSIPQVMLLERATSRAVKATCPEVVMGMAYTTEEVESMAADFTPPASFSPPADPVWPTDYADDTPLTIEHKGAAKAALLALVKNDKALAAAMWPGVELMLPTTLGDLRRVVAEGDRLAGASATEEVEREAGDVPISADVIADVQRQAARDRVAREARERTDEDPGLEPTARAEQRQAPTSAAQRAQDEPPASAPTDQSGRPARPADRARKAVAAARERHQQPEEIELPEISAETREVRRQVLTGIEELGEAYVALAEAELARATKIEMTLDRALVSIPDNEGWNQVVDRVEQAVFARYDEDHGRGDQDGGTADGEET